jgi:hypothetical protein
MAILEQIPEALGLLESFTVRSRAAFRYRSMDRILKLGRRILERHGDESFAFDIVTKCVVETHESKHINKYGTVQTPRLRKLELPKAFIFNKSPKT